MATVRIPGLNQTLTDCGQFAPVLAQCGIIYERWPLAERVDPGASSEEILSAYAPEIEQLKRAGRYVTADVINVTPDTPGLDAMLNRFNKEHRHTEDEVRFIVRGSGVFHINPDPHPVFSITVEAGDLITVPAGTRHWFDLCAERTIRAIRLFRDAAGWTPHYLDDGVHAQYAPLCWGPHYLQPHAALRSPVPL